MGKNQAEDKCGSTQSHVLVLCGTEYSTWLLQTEQDISAQ